MAELGIMESDPIPQMVAHGEYVLLPPGSHPATLDQIETRFVIEAPFAKQREEIFSAYRLWQNQLASIFPEFLIWLDGSFVTHKSWEAPKDIDAYVIVANEHLQSISSEQMTKLDSLRTRKIGGQRIQPFGGLVDSFIFPVSERKQHNSFFNLWSMVKDPSGNTAENIIKGFLEVNSG